MSGNNKDQEHLTAITVAKYALVGSIIGALATIFAAIIGKVNLTIPPNVPLTKTKFLLLENALKSQNWIEADQATDTLNPKNLTCEELQTINEFWLKYSNNKFGYSVQREIWESKNINRNYEEYAGATGWLIFTSGELARVPITFVKKVLTVKELKFINEPNYLGKASRGQLPFNGWQLDFNDLESKPDSIVGIRKEFKDFMSKLKSCKI